MSFIDHPLPNNIHEFLWKQTSPFVKPKFGKHHEASCVFCQTKHIHNDLKEACKVFEKILVQNITSDTRDPVYKQIRNIPRWQLIHSSFPHVVHCVASILPYRKEGLTLTESKLLYILHWMVLDAGQECLDGDYEKGIYQQSPYHYLFSIPSITLFIHLMAPLLLRIKELDFRSFRLESGLGLWQALFEYRHPDALCFTTYAKLNPRHIWLTDGRMRRPSNNTLIPGRKRSDDGPFKGSDSSPSNSSSYHYSSESHISDRQSSTTNQKEKSQKTIVQEYPHGAGEHMVIFRLPSLPESDTLNDSPTIFSGKTSILQLAMGRTAHPRSSLPCEQLTIPQDIKHHMARHSITSAGLRTNKDMTETLKPTVKVPPPVVQDLRSATIMDVAVVRCLFLPQWSEEGILWALNFIYRRLQNMNENVTTQRKSHFRRNSVPNSKINLTLKNENFDPKIKEVDASTRKDIAGFIFAKNNLPMEHANAKTDRPISKSKLEDLKKFLEAKLVSNSGKNLEKFHQVHQRSLDKEEIKHSTHITTSLSKILTSEGDYDLDHLQNLLKGSSMPSLSCLLEKIRNDARIGETKLSLQNEKHHYPNPIITITQHTPNPSPEYLRRKNSSGIALDNLSFRFHKKPKVKGMVRSASDSSINYRSDSLYEAPGSIGFITEDGDLDIEVILKAVHNIAQSEKEQNMFTIRVCQMILDILNLLIEMGILKEQVPAIVDNQTVKNTTKAETFDDIATINSLMTSTVFRIIRRLGCPNHCITDQKPTTSVSSSSVSEDLLRSQCQTLLSTLRKTNLEDFNNFLRHFMNNYRVQEILDFFHSLMGYCVDPNSLLSPNQKRNSKSADSVNQNSYANNFGFVLSTITTGKAIEAQIVSSIFKNIITRLRDNMYASQCKSQENNMAPPHEVRMFINYVKEVYGGVFRRTMLSGLLDTVIKEDRKEADLQTTRVIRHIPQINQDIEVHADSCFTMDSKETKRALLKKKSTSSACANLYDGDISDDSKSHSPHGISRKKHQGLIHRSSERNFTHVSANRNHARSPMTGIVNWFRKEYGRSESFDSQAEVSDSPSDSVLAQQITSYSYSGHQLHKGASSVGQTLHKAKKKVGDQLNRIGFKRVKKKDKSLDDSQGSYFSRRNSIEIGTHSRDSEIVVLKERKLVSIEPLYKGMQRLSFLLDFCHPGTIPDSQLMAAILDLPHTPVISRAAFIMECSYYVHCCSKGQWATWMKISLPGFRASGLRGSAAPNGIRRLQVLQKSAGKTFYSWAEAIGSRLQEMLLVDKRHVGQINSIMLDSNKHAELLLEDEEEDFLDEATVTQYGSDCPLALRMMACNLLLEITAYLRDIYQNLPKSLRTSARDKNIVWDKANVREANRRPSASISIMGQSQVSAQSLQSITCDKETGKSSRMKLPIKQMTLKIDMTSEEGSTGRAIFQKYVRRVLSLSGERKISFILHEPDNGSEDSGNTNAINQTEEIKMQSNIEEKKKSRPSSGQNRPFLLRRSTAGGGGGSFKKRSMKLKKANKDTLKETPMDCDIKRVDSIQSKRQKGSLSDRSDTSEQCGSGEESPGIAESPDDQPPESPTDSNDTDDITSTHMPWIKVMGEMMNVFNYHCTHQGFCHPFCYRRHIRASERLTRALRKVYGEEFCVMNSDNIFGTVEEREVKYQKASTTTSTQPSPIRRKNSLQKRAEKLLSRSTEGMQSIHSKESTKDMVKIGQTDETNCVEGEYEGVGKKTKESSPILKYIKSQVRDAFYTPLATILKAAVILSDEHVVDVMSVAWFLLLESNQEVSSCAASLFIIAAFKAQEKATEIMIKGLHNADASTRILSILRFQVLWTHRYHAWPRMEDRANSTFKLPPPAIEFTFTSPKIGIECLPIVDPPWMPVSDKVPVDKFHYPQESHRSFISTTRKKDKLEAIKVTYGTDHDRRKNDRESFQISSVPVIMQAAYEPNLSHGFFGDADYMEDDEEITETQRASGSHSQYINYLFPSCLCASVVEIINLLDDVAVSLDGNAVYEIAYQIIWNCLVEDSSLFFRYMLERLTRDKQESMFRVLRRLIRFVPKLPQQAAFALYNHIIGYVMFYVRSPHEDGQKMIGAALSILWMVVHSVHGIMFKDLKQILRKEQCDASILLTANVPSTKKIIVHGPQENIKGGIPSQFSVSEDTLFYHIWHESMSFFGIEESEQYQYFLVDQKTRQIHNLNNHIRDYYFFKRSQYPELEVVHLNPEKAFNELQEQELIHKFIEIGKVLLTWAILKNVDMVVQRVVFLHEELMKLPSFPRKALEVHFDLYKGGHIGKELQGLDMLHKFMWVRLIARMFEAMAGNFAYSGDIHLFLNVLNGTLILYGEDACILRYVTATYINAALNFKNIFSNNGYFLIVPTLLQLYSTHRSNKLVTRTVEYTVKQFYLLHRKPFILQMFGSVSSILDIDDDSDLGNANKVEAKCLFRVLLSLETPSPDPLNIGELVKADQPLKETDSCYRETEMINVLSCISLCVMVVAYSPESVRANQMLVILHAIIPCYLKQIQLSSYRKDSKSERDIISEIATCVKTLVSNCESLTKSYVGPQPPSPDHKTSSQKNFTRTGPCSPSYDDEQSRGAFQEKDLEESEPQRVEFRKSRDVLLATVVNFVTKCNTRLIELNKRYPSDGKYVELLSIESYVRLAEIAHSLLKMAVYDPAAMSCRGLQIYMMQLFPFTDWSSEDGIRQTFNNMLRRLEKIFKQIHQRYSIRRTVNWDAACGLIKGLYETMSRYPLVVTLPQVKGIILSCQLLMMGDINDVNITKATSGSIISLMTAIPSASFCSITLRLTTLQILCYRKNARFDDSEISHYSLEEYCQTILAFTDADRINRALFNFFIPLCLRVSTGRTDVACILPKDINYMLKITLETINLSISANSINQYRDSAIWSLPFACSHPKYGPGISCFMYQVGFLALKTMIVCFEGSLETRWIKIVNGIREANNFKDGRKILWNFIEFSIHYKTPLFIHLLPFIHQMVNQDPADDKEKERQQRVKENMLKSSPQYLRSRGCMVTELDKELSELKITLKKYEEIALAKHDERLIRKQQEFLMRKGELKNFKRYEEAFLKENVTDDYPQLEWITQEQRTSSKNKSSETHRGNEVASYDQSENISGKLPKYRQTKTQSRRTFNFRKSRIERSRKSETSYGAPSQSPTSAITRLMMQTPQGRLFQEWNCNQGNSAKGINSEPTSPQSVGSERTVADDVTMISQSSSEAEKAISPPVSFGNGEDSISHCTSSTNAYHESLSLIMAEMNSPLLVQQHPFTCSSTSTIVSPEDFDSDREATSISQHSIVMANPPSKENITYL